MTTNLGVDVSGLAPVEVVRRHAQQLLDALPQVQDVVQLAAELAGTSAAALNLVHSDGQEAFAVWGAEDTACSVEDSLCRHAVIEQGPVLVPDAGLDHRFARNPWVTGELGRVGFYSAHPLRTPDGTFLGTLCVWDEEPSSTAGSSSGGLRSLAAHLEELLAAAHQGTDLRRALDDLDDHQHELRRSNELLAQFAGQVAHDLRTPMSSVRLTLGLLGDLPSLAADPAAGALLRRVESAGDRMERLISGFLALASLEGRTSWAPVDLGELAKEVLDDVAALGDRHRVRVRHLPVVRGDAVQLRALLQNLVTNALKFTASSRVREVTISGGGAAEAWWLDVADTGAGIPEELREVIFQPLVRADTTVDGLGLGLAACRRIASNHHGQISAHESPEGGALFRVVVTPAPRPSVLPQQHQ